MYDASVSSDKKEALKYEAGANGNGITPPDTPKRSQSPRTAGFLPKVPSRSSSPVAIPSKHFSQHLFLLFPCISCNELLCFGHQPDHY